MKNMENKENAGLELVAIAGKPLSVAGVEQFKKALNDSLDALVLNKATPENADMCAKGVTKFNKEMKGYQEQIDFLKAEYDRPLNEAVKPVSEALSQANDMGKAYQQGVLVAKKKAYKEKAKQVFMRLIAIMSDDGTIPDFNAFYDDGWYGLDNQTLEDTIIAKIKKGQKKVDPNATITFVVQGSDQIELARNALVSARVHYTEM